MGSCWPWRRHATQGQSRAWLAAGRPLSRERLGSFEHWAAVIGGVLKVAGVEGFLGNLDELYANADVKGEAWREFTLAWWDEHGATGTHVSELIELCEKQDLAFETICEVGLQLGRHDRKPTSRAGQSHAPGGSE